MKTQWFQKKVLQRWGPYSGLLILLSEPAGADRGERIRRCEMESFFRHVPYSEIL